MRIRLVLPLCVLAILSGARFAAAQTLEGFAKMPANTFAPGPLRGN